MKNNLEKNMITDKSTKMQFHGNDNYAQEAIKRKLELQEAALLEGKVGKWFVYENHSWDDLIYFTSREKTWTERYCQVCEDYDLLRAVCETDEELDSVLTELGKTCELQPSNEYDYEEICRKYGF